MIEITSLIAGYGLDKRGYIISDVSKDKINEVFNRALKRLETASHEEDFITYTQNFARKLIRTYYSMVMARSQIWTTRLHEQAEVFLIYFTEKEPIVRTLLEWVDQPPKDFNVVYELFKREGEWASANFINEAQFH
ncbi:hypothetical protein ACTWQB_04685 [Piscibacillus sp. B03]|uniref:hypothetical protein n=1 Tax=Piscibacillus sp. B03 TaxID=3457430 RepID=UPI003FCE083C